MQKVIKIGDKQYTMKSSAYTQFAYKNETGRSFLTDIKSLTEATESGLEYEKLEEVTELLLKIAYVMAKEGKDAQVTDYKTFLQGIDNLCDDQEWITEVVTLACSPLSRQLQNN